MQLYLILQLVKHQPDWFIFRIKAGPSEGREGVNQLGLQREGKEKETSFSIPAILNLKASMHPTEVMPSTLVTRVKQVQEEGAGGKGGGGAPHWPTTTSSWYWPRISAKTTLQGKNAKYAVLNMLCYFLLKYLSWMWCHGLFQKIKRK